jgi:zinc transport system permease protein
MGSAAIEESEMEQTTNGPHTQHEGEHGHVHNEGCGHETRRHEGHEDYEHDGHWHAKHGDHWDEHDAS